MLEGTVSAHDVHMPRPHTAMTSRVFVTPSVTPHNCYARAPASGMFVGAMSFVSGGPESDLIVKV